MASRFETTVTLTLSVLAVDEDKAREKVDAAMTRVDEHWSAA